MKLKIQYSKTQLEKCVRFIATHNKTFKGKHEYIRQSIRENMQRLAEQFPLCTYMGTMGYAIECFIEAEEGMEEDSNVLRFEFMVDPAVSIDDQEYADEEVVILAKE